MHFDKNEEFKGDYMDIFTKDCCPFYAKITQLSSQMNADEETKLCESIYHGIMREVIILDRISDTFSY